MESSSDNHADDISDRPGGAQTRNCFQVESGEFCFRTPSLPPIRRLSTVWGSEYITACQTVPALTGQEMGGTAW